MHYYKILKHKAGFDEGTNYWEKLLARYLAATGGGKAHTTLPITFTSTSWKLVSWTVYGNNTQHNYSAEATLPLTFTTHTAGNADDWSISGNDSIGKNFLEITAETQTINGVTFTVDKQAGVITANGTASAKTDFTFSTSSFVAGTYILSGVSDGSSSTYYMSVRIDGSYTVSNRLYDGEKSYTPRTQMTDFALTVANGVIVSNLVFKPMLRPADTSPAFEPYQIGIGQRTKNLFPSAAAETKTVGNLSVTSDGNGGYTINKTGALAEETIVMFDVPEFTVPVSQQRGGNGILALFNAKMSTGFQLLFYYNGELLTYISLSTAENRVMTNYSNSLGGQIVDQIAVRMAATQNADVETGVLSPMLTTDGISPSTFDLYGYEVPLTINGTTQDIYIGDSPLIEGETVSKTSTGVDLELFEGENTVGTTLYNKPETSITYTDYLGVGEYVNGQWQIPLTVTCDRNLLNIYGNMAHSGGVHTIDFNVETSSVTGEMSADSRYILGYANAIVKGDETFVISFDKTTVGTAELRMMNGTGSSAEVIETFDISAAKSYRIVFECEESFGNVYPWLVATEAATNTFEHIMIKKASDKGGFVPYNAKYEYNVPIDAPLTEGQTVSNTMEIEVFEGENTIDTTLYNKPEMEITYE